MTSAPEFHRAAAYGEEVMKAEFPHCNSEVLHGPGECVYCDEYPERQHARLAGNTPFSPLEANGWRGNIAWTPEMIEEDLAYWEEMRNSLTVPDEPYHGGDGLGWTTYTTEFNQVQLTRWDRLINAWKAWRNHGN